MWWRAPWLEQRRALLSLAFFDAIVIVGSYNILFWLRFDRWAGITGAVATLVALWLTLSYLLGRYSLGSTDKQFWSIGCVVGIVTGVTMLAAWLGLARDPRALPNFVLPLLALTATFSALAERGIEQQTRRPREWALLLTGGESDIIQKELRSVGTINRLQITISSPGQRREEILGSCERAKGIVLGEQLELESSEIQNLLKRRSKGQQIMCLMDWCERHLQRVPPELLSEKWLLMAEGFQLRPGEGGWRLKRFGDLLIAGLLLAITSPIIAIVALLIKLEDGGPVLYNQIRTGLYGTRFRIWKLRTMRVEAEHAGPQWAGRNDQRITRIGRILRKLRIDELPQLVNVITGDMSLIGPRPERPELEAELEKQIPHYRVRQWIRPGLSGWAQVCYPYGASIEDSRTKLSYDLYYLRNFSIALDTLIVLKTIRLISNAEGATPRAEEPVN